MRKVFLVIVVLVMGATAYPLTLSTTGPAFDAHPGPPAESEFYWDDGSLAGGWVWFTAGSYWAVDFDDEKTGGVADGTVYSYGAVTYPLWPGSTYEGCYMHALADDGGYPGANLDSTYLGFTGSGTFEWVDTNVGLTTSTFYIGFEQIGGYPNCDAIGVDASSGAHNWTGYQGSWGSTTNYGDFMLRCYWEGVEDFQPPEVTNMDPDDGEVDVSVDTTIVFHVVDDVSGVDVATIELTVEDASRGPVRVNLAFSTDGPTPTGEISGELEIDDTDPLDVVCTFTPDSDLPYGETITCTVPAGLADEYGNETSQDTVWDFTTEDAPGVKNSTWGEIKALY